MLTAGGAKLLDFGLAKAIETRSGTGALTSMPTRTLATLTTEGTIVGTVAYMAPEQLEGKEADARTDIFAFGGLLYEMLTSRRAFGGDSQASLITSIMSADPAPVSAIQPMASPTLERAIRKCLSKSPEQRWQSVRDLMSELQWIACRLQSSLFCIGARNRQRSIAPASTFRCRRKTSCDGSTYRRHHRMGDGSYLARSAANDNPGFGSARSTLRSYNRLPGPSRACFLFGLPTDVKSGSW